jgi:hypothetical protein
MLEKTFGAAMRASLGIRKKIISRAKDGKQMIHLVTDEAVIIGDLLEVEDPEGTPHQARVFHVEEMEAWDDEKGDSVPAYEFWAEILEEGSTMTKDEWEELYGDEEATDVQEASDEVPADPEDDSVS